MTTYTLASLNSIFFETYTPLISFLIFYLIFLYKIQLTIVISIVACDKMMHENE